MTDSFPTRADALILVGVLLTSGLLATVLSGCHQTNGGRGAPSASAQETVLPSRVHGCWTLRLKAKGPQRDSLRAWLPAGSLPPTVELDSMRADDMDEAEIYVAHSWFGERRKPQPFSVWRPLGSDSIRVQRAGALAGTMLQVGPAESTLVGHVIVYRDVGMGNTSTQRTGSVTMTPTRCPDA